MRFTTVSAPSSLNLRRVSVIALCRRFFTRLEGIRGLNTLSVLVFVMSPTTLKPFVLNKADDDKCVAPTCGRGADDCGCCFQHCLLDWCPGHSNIAPDHRHESGVKPFKDEAELLDSCDCGAVRFKESAIWWVPEMRDKLSRIFGLQEDLQERLGTDYDQAFINQMTLAAIVELAEFVQNTDWKGWKTPIGLQREKAIEEWADALHFFVNLALAIGLDADTAFDAYARKNIINHQRQEKGY